VWKSKRSKVHELYINDRQTKGSMHDENKKNIMGVRKGCSANLARISFLCGPVWHSSASPAELFFRKQLHEQLHERGRELCFCSFTMCLTLWEWVFREADQRVGQRVDCLAVEVVKLLVKLLMKLYQTGPIYVEPSRCSAERTAVVSVVRLLHWILFSALTLAYMTW
jgi:hypothetical protein